jgi:hypothetical protein
MALFNLWRALAALYKVHRVIWPQWQEGFMV